MRRSPGGPLQQRKTQEEEEADAASIAEDATTTAEADERLYAAGEAPAPQEEPARGSEEGYKVKSQEPLPLDKPVGELVTSGEEVRRGYPRPLMTPTHKRSTGGAVNPENAVECTANGDGATAPHRKGHGRCKAAHLSCGRSPKPVTTQEGVLRPMKPKKDVQVRQSWPKIALHRQTLPWGSRRSTTRPPGTRHHGSSYTCPNRACG